MMSSKLKLAAILAATALALPAIAAAQDPRTEIIITGAVSADKVEQVDDESATEAAELPVVYEDAADAGDEAETVAAEDSATADADLGQAVETQ